VKAVLQVTRVVSTPTANGFVARLQTTPVATTIAAVGPQGPMGTMSFAVHVSTIAPTAGDGSDGDLWFEI
jgi:hypothetical protein